jgi:hypothetical protein
MEGQWLEDHEKGVAEGMKKGVTEGMKKGVFEVASETTVNFPVWPGERGRPRPSLQSTNKKRD